MRCPRCKLENPPSALRCDCGYDFPSGRVKQSYVSGPAGPDVFAEGPAAVARTYDSNIIAHVKGAAMIDVLVGLVLLVPLLPYYLTLHSRLAQGALIVLEMATYVVLTLGRWGATLGMLVARIRLVDERCRAPGYLRALLRMVAGNRLAGTYVLYAKDVRRVRERGIRRK